MAMTELSAAYLETESILTEILGMIQTRASAVKVTTTNMRDLGQPFPHNATVISKIQYLRNMILDLAPKFVDMDYPYFNKTWIEFPKFFTANQIRDDQEHGLNVLPAKDSSFDEDSIEVYRKALADMIYWLEKFRYVYAEATFCDKTFKRNWQWRQSRNYTAWAYEYDSQENGVEGHESSMAGLQGSMVGVIDNEGPISFSSRYGINPLWVNFRQFESREKFYSYKNSGENSKPLTLWEEIDHTYAYTGVPHILTTRNPTCFVPTLYWYFVPNAGGRQLEQETDYNLIVGTVEPWTTHTWGPNGEYSATEYHVTEGGTDHENLKVSFKNNWKQRQSKMTSGDSKTTTTTETITNYSSDGERSFSKTTTETLSSSYYVSTNWLNEQDDDIATYGFFTLNANTAPRREAGIIAPYSSLSWTVCEQNSLIDSNVPSPVAQYDGEDKFCYGVNSIGWLEVTANAKWVPILDFKDFSTEVPEQNP